MKPVFIIAEAGVNHNGSLDTAKKLVEKAAWCGADAVKFQTFKAEHLVCRDAAKADYQTKTTKSGESQFEMLKQLELSDSDHRALLRHCQKFKIQFLSSPFDIFSLRFLISEMNLPLIKLGSGELTNAPLLLEAAWSQKPVFLSTGMSDLGEVEVALSVLAFGYANPKKDPKPSELQDALKLKKSREILREKVSLLHCTTEYPAPIEESNLKAIDTMREAFGLEVGFSDHTPGIQVSVAAVARGASVIEKHFTLSRSMPGPDHKASLEPEGFKEMVATIRQVESALGSGKKEPAASERKNISIARRSLVAAKAIAKGEVFSKENLAVKRPGTGLSPFELWRLLGKKSKRAYKTDQQIEDRE